jgi:ubiquinone/menaquinone biosynthesis C-methylase UbiE
MPGHSHHGHQHDRGAAGLLRYLALLPHMWTSEVGREVVKSIDPRPGERVVDLGSGMGSATVDAARSGASVIAVDPTAYMRWILELRRKWQGARARITVVEGAAESIPSSDGSVDALWTVNTIHHWTDRATAVRQLARVMRPGGRVLLVDEDLDDSAHPFHERSRARRTRHGQAFDEVDAEALAASLVESGFASAHGSRTRLAGRPVKLVRASR